MTASLRRAYNRPVQVRARFNTAAYALHSAARPIPPNFRSAAMTSQAASRVSWVALALSALEPWLDDEDGPELRRRADELAPELALQASPASTALTFASGSLLRALEATSEESRRGWARETAVYAMASALTTLGGLPRGLRAAALARAEHITDRRAERSRQYKYAHAMTPEALACP